MSKKRKGINAERELVHLFWKKGWAAIRIAGSGSIRYPSADILASNGLRKLAIECKTTRTKKKYLKKKEIKNFKKFASIFGAEPWIGIKFKKTEWLFLSLDDLKKTKNSFLITMELARKKGFLLEELIT